MSVRRLIYLVGMVLLAACESDDVALPAPAAESVAEPLIYQCEGFQFRALAGVSRVTLWRNGEEIVLPRVASASGSKYQDGEFIFWSKGDSALLEWGEQQLRPCSLLGSRDGQDLQP